MSVLDDTIDKVCDAASEFGDGGPRIRAWRKKLAGKPPERDLKIFKAVMIEHRKHEEAARLFGLTRGRITQIVRRLCRELAEAPPDDPEIKGYLARERLGKRLDQMRLEYVLEETAKALRDDPRHLEIKRQGTRVAGQKEENWEEVTVRQQPVNVQLLKTFLRTAEAMRTLREDLGEEEPKKKLTDVELFEAINLIFECWFGRVQLEPDPPSHEFLQLVGAFRAEMYGWVLECKRGTPRAEAWPKDDRQRRLGAMIADRGYLISFNANLANQASEPINPICAEARDGNLNGIAGNGLSCDQPGVVSGGAEASC